nr:hypothetical protein [Rhodomicrobium lacus]
MRRASGFGKPAAAGFPQAVRRPPLGNACHPGLLGKPIIEARFRESLAELRFDEQFLPFAHRHRLDRHRELLQNRDVDFRAGLLLPVDEPAAAKVRAFEPHDIAPARRRTEHQFESQPLARSHRVTGGKEFDFVVRPVLEALDLVADRFDLGHRIDRDHLAFAREFHDGAQHPPQIVRGCRRCRFLVQDRPDMLLFELCHREFAVVRPEAFEDAAIGLTRGVG